LEAIAGPGLRCSSTLEEHDCRLFAACKHIMLIMLESYLEARQAGQGGEVVNAH